VTHQRQIERATIGGGPTGVGWVQAAIEPQAIPAPRPVRIIYRRGETILARGRLSYADAMRLVSLMARAGFQGVVEIAP